MTDPAQLDARFVKIRDDGFVWVFKEFTDDINSVAAPIASERQVDIRTPRSRPGVPVSGTIDQDVSAGGSLQLRNESKRSSANRPPEQLKRIDHTTMDARIFVEPQQGTTYTEIVALARHAGSLGFDGFFSSDHILKMGDHDSGLPGPLETWTTFAGLARDTERIRLGSLVSPVTFHHPAQLAMTVAQIDDMSGGRIELGLGAGWFEAEHNAHGLEFPDVNHRFDHLTESLAIISGMWATPEAETFSFAGEHYEIPTRRRSQSRANVRRRRSSSADAVFGAHRRSRRSTPASSTSASPIPSHGERRATSWASSASHENGIRKP